MKDKYKTKKIAGILLAASMMVVGSCAQIEDDDDDDSSSNPPQQQEEQDQGEYRTILVPVNRVIINNITTINNINISGDQIRINIVVRGTPPLTKHKQAVHKGRSCPTIADDQNGDGFVDGVEALSRTEGIIVPLDDELDTQEAGSGDYPFSDVRGEYSYLEDASFGRMLADLRAPDLDPNDQYVKLGANEDLNLGSRVFVVYGLPSSVPLPSTVRGLPGETPHESFPIGCGQLQQFSTGTTGSTAGGTIGGTVGGTTIGGTGGGTTGGSSGGTSGGSSGGSSSGGSNGGSSGGSEGGSEGGSSGGSNGGSSGDSNGGSSGGMIIP